MSISDHGPAFLRMSPVGRRSRHEPRKKDQAKSTISSMDLDQVNYALRTGT